MFPAVVPETSDVKFACPITKSAFAPLAFAAAFERAGPKTRIVYVGDGKKPFKVAHLYQLQGKDYVGILRNGALEERWVDVYPNKGKRSGAFSWGAPGTHPFIMMSYTDEVFSVSTLAHELGHSMHSYLTWQNQPFVYADYSLFAAEVASNFHQAMVRGYLLKTRTDRDFQRHFDAFYRVRRASEWRGAFFELMEKSKSSSMHLKVVNWTNQAAKTQRKK